MAEIGNSPPRAIFLFLSGQPYFKDLSSGSHDDAPKSNRSPFSPAGPSTAILTSYFIGVSSVFVVAYSGVGIERPLGRRARRVVESPFTTYEGRLGPCCGTTRV